MKKIIVILLVAASNASAWEFKDNPDRFPSLGFNYFRHDASADYLLLTNNSLFSFKDGVKFGQSDYTLDLRLPLSNNFTLNLGGGYSSYSLTLRDDTVNMCGLFLCEVNFPVKGELTGYNAHFGIRWYIH